MRKGKVKFFNQAKGFGFIIDKENNEEIFVHATGCEDTIKEGDSVSFEISEGKKGPNAVKVNLV